MLPQPLFCFLFGRLASQLGTQTLARQLHLVPHNVFERVAAFVHFLFFVLR